MCGGSLTEGVLRVSRNGLSPRVRGKQTLSRIQGRRGRSIPACAGEAAFPSLWFPLFGVYPRVCGGSADALDANSANDGLSPRVRGKHPSPSAALRCARSIPACAGEARQAAGVADAMVVYPRVCGGSLGPHAATMRAAGLSPRVRGKPAAARAALLRLRSIPACAGEAVIGLGIKRGVEVYPRVCGGSAGLTMASTCARGLSPRVRGKPAQMLVSAGFTGSIPACAGEA